MNVLASLLLCLLGIGGVPPPGGGGAGGGHTIGSLPGGGAVYCRAFDYFVALDGDLLLGVKASGNVVILPSAVADAIESYLAQDADPPQTAECTWTSGGTVVTVKTPKKLGESNDNWGKRHAAACAAMKQHFPPDSGSGSLNGARLWLLALSDDGNIHVPPMTMLPLAA